MATTFTNQAQLAYNNVVTNSNIVVGQINSVLTVTKTALSDTYNADGSVTYIISLVNSGNTALNGLTVNDNLGSYTFNMQTLYPVTYVTDSLRYFVNGALQSTPTVNPGPPLSITNVDIPAGANAVIIYQANPNQYAPRGNSASITNQVSVSGSGLAAPVTADDTITADETPELSITKSLSPTTVLENGQLTYTFTIVNTGTEEVTAGDNARITDTFDPKLTNITVKFNDTTWADPTNYSYTEGTGEFATVAGQITVPPATVAQNPTNGAWIVTPGVSTLTVTGTV